MIRKCSCIKLSTRMDGMFTSERGAAVFSEQFEALTGFKPMRWQQRLYDEHFAMGTLPSAVSVPTGLGETAVMAIWMVAPAAKIWLALLGDAE